MGTAPIYDPSWATDSTVASGPEATKTVRVYPTSGVIQQGFQADQGVAARTANGVVGNQGDWIKYLRESTGDRLGNIDQTYLLPTSDVSESSFISTSHAFDVTGNPYTPSVAPTVMQNIAGCIFVWQLSCVLPRNALLTGLNIQVQGGSSYASLPAMPTIGLYLIAPTGVVMLVGSTVTDTAGGVAAFKLRHTLQVSYASLPVFLGDPSQRLIMVVTGAGTTFADKVAFAEPRATVIACPWS